MTNHPSSLKYALQVLENHVEDIDGTFADLKGRGREPSDQQEAQYELAWEAVDAVRAVTAGADAFRGETLAEFPEEFFGNGLWGKEPFVYHVDRGAIGSLIEDHPRADALLEAIRAGRAWIDLHIELPTNTLSVEIRSDDPALRMEPWMRFRNGMLDEVFIRTESGITVQKFGG